MDPGKFQYRIFDLVAGKRYFRNWLEQSLDAMQRVAADRAQRAGTVGSRREQCVGLLSTGG